MKALRAAAPYLSEFRGKTFVLKLGGETIENASMLRSVAEQIALLWQLGIRLVLVHGGGTAVDRISERMSIPVEKVDGRRITSPEALEAVKMGLKGSVQADLVAELSKMGLPAVGLTGLDAGLLPAHRRPLRNGVDYGLVGDLDDANPALLTYLLQGGYLPVVAPLCGNGQGEIYNVNADTVASTVAIAIGAEKLLFVLKAPGLLRDVSNASSVIPFLSIEEAETLVAEGVAAGGMAPKIAAARLAIDGGVHAVQLVGGGAEDGLLLEIFTNEGSGTMIQRDTNGG